MSLRGSKYLYTYEEDIIHIIMVDDSIYVTHRLLQREVDFDVGPGR